MIADWQRAWGIGDFPFYFVQIAPFNYDGSDAAFLRKAQMKSLAVPNTGMVCTMDLGLRRTSIRTTSREVGRRLANAALAQTYGKSDVVASGPIPDGHATNGLWMRAAVRAHQRGGLVAPREFERVPARGRGPAVLAAKAVIDGDNVYVTSDKVPEPVAVSIRVGGITDGDALQRGRAAGDELPHRTTGTTVYRRRRTRARPRTSPTMRRSSRSSTART